MNKKYIDFVPVSRVNNVPGVKQVNGNVRIAKKQKVGGVKVVQKTIVEKKSEVVTEMKELMPIEDAEKKSKMKIPQARFINQEKVVKRPLSKNVYEREPEKKEKNSGLSGFGDDEPVMIVGGKKKTKAGTIIAIIVAIILGAAAGTAVFFLLPK